MSGVRCVRATPRMLPGALRARMRSAGRTLFVCAAVMTACATHVLAKDHPRPEALVPELGEHPYQLDPGRRVFANRIALSPGYGRFGSQPLFLLRAAYNPGKWLGYEASIAHNPGESVHAVLHSLSAIVRVPMAGRFQPYAAAGYGMMFVFPGRSLNASPVTKNALAVGGGLEVYLRNDLALRGDMRYATVFGRERDRDGVITYDYLQQTIGLTFYRTLHP